MARNLNWVVLLICGLIGASLAVQQLEIINHNNNGTTLTTLDIPGCKCTMPSGKTYDLNSIAGLDAYAYSGEMEYRYLPCGAIPSTQCGNFPTPAVCQKQSGSSWSIYSSCGKYVGACSNWKELTPVGSGVALYFEGGDLQRTTTVNIKCTKIAGSLRFVLEQPMFNYVLEWENPAGCPQGGGDGGDGDEDATGGLSVGWILIIVLGCVIVLYIVGGLVFNKFYRKIEGIDVIPNREFWWALPFLVWEGHKYFFGGVMTIVNRLRGGSEYTVYN